MKLDMSDIIKKVIEIDYTPLTKEEADSIYKEDYKKNFLKSRHNPIMKKYVKECNNNICAICGTEIYKDEPFTLYEKHKSECVFPYTIKTPYKTTTGRRKMLKVPDCAKCYAENADKFQECVSWWKPVHLKCNSWKHVNDT